MATDHPRDEFADCNSVSVVNGGFGFLRVCPSFIEEMILQYSPNDIDIYLPPDEGILYSDKLNVLSAGSLKNVQIAVTHIKPCENCTEKIIKEIDIKPASVKKIPKKI